MIKCNECTPQGITLWWHNSPTFKEVLSYQLCQHGTYLFSDVDKLENYDNYFDKLDNYV